MKINLHFSGIEKCDTLATILTENSFLWYVVAIFWLRAYVAIQLLLHQPSTRKIDENEFVTALTRDLYLFEYFCLMCKWLTKFLKKQKTYSLDSTFNCREMLRS